MNGVVGRTGTNTPTKPTLNSSQPNENNSGRIIARVQNEVRSVNPEQVFRFLAETSHDAQVLYISAFDFTNPGCAPYADSH